MIDNNKKFKFGYEDTDKKIEIELYGLIFEIRNVEKINEIKSEDKKDKEVLEAQIELLLGNGSIDKINRKREKDGYDELTAENEMAILGCIFEAYYESFVGNFTDKVTGTVTNINNKLENLNNFNREERRYRKYNKNYRRNRRRF